VREKKRQVIFESVSEVDSGSKGDLYHATMSVDLWIYRVSQFCGDLKDTQL
jgi:hypothetical protein